MMPGSWKAEEAFLYRRQFRAPDQAKDVGLRDGTGEDSRQVLTSMYLEAPSMPPTLLPL